MNPKGEEDINGSYEEGQEVVSVSVNEKNHSREKIYIHTVCIRSSSFSCNSLFNQHDMCFKVYISLQRIVLSFFYFFLTKSQCCLSDVLIGKSH